MLVAREYQRYVNDRTCMYFMYVIVIFVLCVNLCTWPMCPLCQLSVALIYCFNWQCGCFTLHVYFGGHTSTTLQYVLSAIAKHLLLFHCIKINTAFFYDRPNSTGWPICYYFTIFLVTSQCPWAKKHTFIIFWRSLFPILDNGTSCFSVSGSKFLFLHSMPSSFFEPYSFYRPKAQVDWLHTTRRGWHGCLRAVAVLPARLLLQRSAHGS